MSTEEWPSIHAGWKAGAKALAQFQSLHHGVAKGGEVTGGPREGSKYATLKDILAVAAMGSQWGLSHTGQSRLVGENLLVWREVLHHESGESVYTEHPIAIPEKGLPGQRQQDLGGAITYARKYCIQALYGLYADDGLDPDTVSYGDAARSAPSPKTKPAPLPVTVEKSQPADDSKRELTEDEKALAMSIIKDPDKGAEYKAEFIKRFYPSKEKLLARDIKCKEHLDFLTLLKSGVPF